MNKNNEKPQIQLKKLTLTNFKNFEKAELAIGPTTIVVGANATGKSNLREAFRFLHGIGRGYTLNEIISEKWDRSGERTWDGIRGGLRELGHIYTYKDEQGFFYKVSPSFVIDVQLSLTEQQKEIPVAYYLLVALRKHAVYTPKVFEEIFTYQNIQLFHVQDEKGFEQFFSVESTSLTGRIAQTDIEGILDQPMLTHLAKPNNNTNYYYSTDFLFPDSHKKELLIIQAIHEHFQSFRFFEFNPEVMRQVSLPGQQTLTSNGSNLSSVLHTIYQDPQRKESFVSWLRELTPMDVTDLNFFEDEVGRVRAQIVEQDGRKISIYSISDGTLRFLGLLAALYDPEPASLYFFEEIETGIHPARQYLLLQLIEQRAKETGLQVIITTHSPALLNMVSEETLEYVSLLYRLENKSATTIKRIVDIPDAVRLAKKKGLAPLHMSGWFENAMYFMDEEE